MSSLPDPVTLVALIVAFGLASFAALMLTSYTKLVIVFGLLRAALGLQQTPPNMVLNGIAVILSIYIMAPVGMAIDEGLRGRTLGAPGAAANDVATVLEAARTPVKAFLTQHTRERERQFFLKSASQIWPKPRADNLTSDDLLVLVPSFVLSELTRAFQIGFIMARTGRARKTIARRVREVNLELRVPTRLH